MALEIPAAQTFRHDGALWGVTPTKFPSEPGRDWLLHMWSDDLEEWLCIGVDFTSLEDARTQLAA
jgi:hypothetical protein